MTENETKICRNMETISKDRIKRTKKKRIIVTQFAKIRFYYAIIQKDGVVIFQQKKQHIRLTYMSNVYII